MQPARLKESECGRINRIMPAKRGICLVLIMPFVPAIGSQ